MHPSIFLIFQILKKIRAQVRSFPYKNGAFAGSVASDRGDFSANQSKPWRNAENSYTRHYNNFRNGYYKAENSTRYEYYLISVTEWNRAVHYLLRNDWCEFEPAEDIKSEIMCLPE